MAVLSELAELPSSPIPLPQPPPELIKRLKARQCVLFAGAGLSSFANVPTWDELMRQLACEARKLAPYAAPELDRLIAAQRYLEVADHCKAHLQGTYNQVLTQLRAGSGSVPEAQKLVIRLPFAAWVTTNYDKLLERAFVEVRSDWPRVFTHSDTDIMGTLLFDGAPFILKAHGDIDKPDTIVLTTRDYNQIIHANPGFNSLFSALLLTKAIFFIGYSLHDPDFQLLMGNQITIFNGQVPDRFALMAGVGEIESEVLWRTARIKVIPYDKGQHLQVLSFLQALVQAVESRMPDADAERAVSKATGRSRQFTALDKGMVARGSVIATDRPPRALPPEVMRLSVKLGGGRLMAAFSERDPGTRVAGEGPSPDWEGLIGALRTLGSAMSADRDYQAVGQALACCLPTEVLSAVCRTVKRQGSDHQLLALSLAEELEPLPWELLWIDDKHLATRVALVRTPAGISDEARGAHIMRRPTLALLIGDPNENLPGARREVEEIYELYVGAQAASCKMLVGADATPEAVQGELDRTHFDIVHFAGHAWYDAQEVYLALSGDVRMTANGLRPMLCRQPPAVLFLNSHFTAFVPPGVASDHPSDLSFASPIKPRVGGWPGFMQLASLAGVGAFIGCFGQPDDDAAADLAVEVHRRLLAGAAVAGALFGARRKVVESTNTSLLYSLSGASEVRLLVRGRQPR